MIERSVRTKGCGHIGYRTDCLLTLRMAVQNGVDRRFRLPRLWSNEVLRRIAPLFEGEVVNVSGWDDRDKQGGRYRDYFTRASHYYISNHDGKRGLDDYADSDFAIDLTQPLPQELRRRFDVVYNHTTLEHIFDVEAAFGNLCEMTKDVVIVVVPFAQEVHYQKGSYGDYWRFTPMGLRELYRQHGLEMIYEAANRHVNAGIYLLFVGSRNPAAWRERMPACDEVDDLGEWIGGKIGQPIKNVLASLVRRVGKRLRSSR